MPDTSVTRKGKILIDNYFDVWLKDTRSDWLANLYPAEEQIRDQAEIDAELRRGQ